MKDAQDDKVWNVIDWLTLVFQTRERAKRDYGQHQ